MATRPAPVLALLGMVVPPANARPSDVAENVPLAPHTSLGVGGPARYWLRPADAERLVGALAWAHAAKLALFVLGGGSNVVVADAGFAGLVLQLPPARPQRWPSSAVATCAPVELWVDGALPWDTFCRQSVARGLQGMECMVGIPGTMAASVLQNVGAYGQQLADVCLAVEAVEAQSGQKVRLQAADCGFGYRTSHFKERWRGRYIVTALQLRLHAGRPATVTHEGLRRALAAEGGGLGAANTAEVAQVAKAVLTLRQQKSMLLDPADANARSVGSFFLNPEVAPAQARRLRRACPDMPYFAGARRQVKLSAAWLIEHAGLARGHVFAEARGRIGLSQHHALALVNRGDARAEDVILAARAVQRAVRAQFQIDLVAEPRLVGFAGPVLTL